MEIKVTVEGNKHLNLNTVQVLATLNCSLYFHILVYTSKPNRVCWQNFSLQPFSHLNYSWTVLKIKTRWTQASVIIEQQRSFLRFGEQGAVSKSWQCTAVQWTARKVSNEREVTNSAVVFSGGCGSASVWKDEFFYSFISINFCFFMYFTLFPVMLLLYFIWLRILYSVYFSFS